jgi:hypothetical protein
VPAPGILLSPGKLPLPGVAGRPEPAVPGVVWPLLAVVPDEELLPVVLLWDEDGVRPLEKSGNPGMDADAPDCRAPGEGIEGMPAEERCAPGDELDDELDEELELELDDELDEELELDGDGIDGIDDDGIDGICGMLDCVCWAVSHALSNAAASPMAITRRCCNSFIFPYPTCTQQIDDGA